MSNDIDKFIGKLVRVSEGGPWTTEGEKHRKKLDARNKRRKKSASERKASSAKASANVEKQLAREKKEAEKFAKKIVKIPKPQKNVAYKKSGGGLGGGRWHKDPKTGRRTFKVM